MYGALEKGAEPQQGGELNEMGVRLRGKGSPSRNKQVDTDESRDEPAEDHTVTAGLTILAGAFERADENILPAVFKGLERDLHWRPSQLGQLVMARTLVMAMASPIFGTLADSFIGRRERLVGWSCFGYVLNLEVMCCFRLRRNRLLDADARGQCMRNQLVVLLWSQPSIRLISNRMCHVPLEELSLRASPLFGWGTVPDGLH